MHPGSLAAWPGAAIACAMNVQHRCPLLSCQPPCTAVPGRLAPHMAAVICALLMGRAGGCNGCPSPSLLHPALLSGSRGPGAAHAHAANPTGNIAPRRWLPAWARWSLPTAPGTDVAMRGAPGPRRTLRPCWEQALSLHPATGRGRGLGLRVRAAAQSIAEHFLDLLCLGQAGTCSTWGCVSGFVTLLLT